MSGKNRESSSPLKKSIEGSFQLTKKDETPRFQRKSRSSSLLNDSEKPLFQQTASENKKGLFLSACSICDNPKLVNKFICHGYPVCQCDKCGLMFLNPQPSDPTLSDIYSKGYFLEEDGAMYSEMKKATAILYLSRLSKYMGSSRGRLIELGCGTGEFLVTAQKSGFDVSGTDVSAYACEAANKILGGSQVKCGTIENLDLPRNYYDVCVMCDVIEHGRDPVSFLRGVKEILRPGGVLFISTPSLDSWSAKLMKQNWMEFKVEHLYYFNRETIQRVLARTGFGSVEITPTYKCLTLEYIDRHFERYPVPFFTKAIQLICSTLPRRLARKQFSVKASGINVLCRTE